MCGDCAARALMTSQLPSRLPSLTRIELVAQPGGLEDLDDRVDRAPDHVLAVVDRDHDGVGEVGRPGGGRVVGLDGSARLGAHHALSAPLVPSRPVVWSSPLCVVHRHEHRVPGRWCAPPLGAPRPGLVIGRPADVADARTSTCEGPHVEAFTGGFDSSHGCSVATLDRSNKGCRRATHDPRRHRARVRSRSRTPPWLPAPAP